METIIKRQTEVNHNNLPQVVAEMAERQECILKQLQLLNNQNQNPQRPRNANLKGVINHIKEVTGKHYAPATLYGLVCHRKIPFIKHKDSKELIFCLDHIDLWLGNGKSMTGLDLIPKAK